MLTLYCTGLIAAIIMATLTWAVSVKQHNVAIVDIVWSLMIWVIGSIYWLLSDVMSVKQITIYALLSCWAFRLSFFLAKRNWRKTEDRRYQEIRASFSPNFALKSLPVIFIFQAVLASWVALPLLTIFSSAQPLQWFDIIGLLLLGGGFIIEAIADRQLQIFKIKNSNNPDAVCCTGLWRYSRHPNYFGEFCVWWGIYLLALSAGGYWTIISPLLMSFLLLKFSGVGRMEKQIDQRRSEYIKYKKNTSVFFPWFPKKESIND